MFVQKYTEALALTDVDAHVFYSNRSATYMALEKYESAKADAQKCMELKPMWSKVTEKNIELMNVSDLE